MLAYIFWHWPFPEIDRQAYEREAVAFHSALAKTRPPGLHGSWTFRIGSVPWIADQRRYEDWYLVEDFAALGVLSEVAVAEACIDAHNRIARAAAGGAGGLYRLRTGEPRVAESGFAAWITKDRGTTYDDFYRQTEPLAERAGGSLWRRDMALGPAREFCLLSPDRPRLPAEIPALVVRRNPIQTL